MGKLLKEINALARKSNAKFISFKFIDSSGQLHQIDSLISNLQYKDDKILIHDLMLTPIANKFFLDPFRSFPTIVCLCENNIAPVRFNFLEYLEVEHSEGSALECSLEFTALNKNNNFRDDDYCKCNFAVEPLDKLANLRAEIVLAFENASISSTHHYSTGNYISVVAFKAKNFLELADNYIIAKYIIANMAESYGKSADFAYDSNNKVQANKVIISNYNKDFVQKFEDMIKSVSRESSPLLKAAALNLSSTYDDQHNKLAINFDNSKINPYLIFSFFNPSNYKTDMIAKEFLKEIMTRELF